MINLQKLPEDIIFLIHTKAFELQTQGVQKVNPQDIKSYLYAHQWKNKDEASLCDVVDDIMSIDFSALYDYLSAKVIQEAKFKNLEDFESLIAK